MSALRNQEAPSINRGISSPVLFFYFYKTRGNKTSILELRPEGTYYLCLFFSLTSWEVFPRWLSNFFLARIKFPPSLLPHFNLRAVLQTFQLSPGENFFLVCRWEEWYDSLSSTWSSVQTVLLQSVLQSFVLETVGPTNYFLSFTSGLLPFSGFGLRRP